jgi:hypothetical protein
LFDRNSAPLYIIKNKKSRLRKDFQGRWPPTR